MKKYILGSIALLMIIAMIAFPAASKSKDVKAADTYWFLMDESGTTVTTTQVSDPSTLCPTKTLANCARQYNESQTEIVAGIRQVKTSQVNAPIDYRTKP